VFVMMQLTPPENFSFASGASGSDIAANEARDRAAAEPGTPDAHETTPRRQNNATTGNQAQAATSTN
jgi:hypothetical protein